MHQHRGIAANQVEAKHENGRTKKAASWQGWKEQAGEPTKQPTER